MSKKVVNFYNVCFGSEVIFTGSKSQCEFVYSACFNLLQHVDCPGNFALLITYCPATTSGGFLHV